MCEDFTIECIPRVIHRRLVVDVLWLAALLLRLDAPRFVCPVSSVSAQSLFALLWMVTVFGLVFTDKCYVRVFSPAWTVATAIALLIGLINLLISNILAFCVSRKHVVVFTFFCFGAVGVVIAQIGLLSIAGQISLASGNYLIVLTAVLLVLFAYEHYVYWFIMRKQCYY